VEINVQEHITRGLLSKKEAARFLQFYHAYCNTLTRHHVPIPMERLHSLFTCFIEQIASPFSFSPYHKQIRTPFDYYALGIELFRPLIDASSITGKEQLHIIEKQLYRKENVIFLANHQIEADPQVLSLLFEEQHPKLAEELICIAGERVLIDPFAIPFSLGRNLLCIYSKRHIDHPPEQKTEKLLHNQKTMELLCGLLSEGGHAIYVAPSGGRDRPDEHGIVHIAPFDPQSIEMLYLMTKKATRPTSFYPMALSTHDLLPPPRHVEKVIGEERTVERGAAHMWIGAAIDMALDPHLPKRAARTERALRIWTMVDEAYQMLRRLS